MVGEKVPWWCCFKRDETVTKLKYGLPINRKIVLYTYEFAMRNNISLHFNNEKKLLVNIGLVSFLIVILIFHLDVPLLYNTSFTPTSIHNMNETGISTIPNNPPIVIPKKGKRAVNKISSAERETNVRMVNTRSPTGQFHPFSLHL